MQTKAISNLHFGAAVYPGAPRSQPVTRQALSRLTYGASPLRVTKGTLNCASLWPNTRPAYYATDTHRNPGLNQRNKITKTLLNFQNILKVQF